MLAHYNGVKDLIAGEPTLAGKVHSAALVNPSGAMVRETYVILFGGPPETLDDGRPHSPQGIDADAEYLYTARCVSTTGDGALAVAAKVLKRTVGVVLTIPDRECQPIELDDSTNVTPDDNVKPPLYYVDLDLLLKSSRAP